MLQDKPPSVLHETSLDDPSLIASITYGFLSTTACGIRSNIYIYKLFPPKCVKRYSMF